MAQVSSEELHKIQSERLERIRRLKEVDPERAKRESHKRLVRAGLVQKDGSPTPLYA